MTGVTVPPQPRLRWRVPLSFFRRPGPEQFARRWQTDDVPKDVFDLRSLKRAVDPRATVLRKLANYSDEFARSFAEATIGHGIEVAARALSEASLDEEAAILMEHDLPQLAENSRALSERIFAPAETAALEANAADSRAEAAHSVANVWIDTPGRSQEDVIREMAPGGISERALRAGFEASLAQQRAFVTAGAALAARAMILATKALVPPFGAGDAAAVGVLTACACGQKAGSASHMGPPMKPREDPLPIWRRATHEELARQTSWILGAIAS